VRRGRISNPILQEMKCQIGTDLCLCGKIREVNASQSCELQNATDKCGETLDTVKKITDGRGGSGSKVGEAPADVGNISEAVDVERKNIKIGQLPLLDGWRSDSRNGHGRKSKDERGLHFYDVIGKDVRDQSSCCLEVMIEECDCEC
jgi:hypothetical protein